MFLDTPLPPEEPTGTNPPDGAIIDYVLHKDVKNVNVLVKDPKGEIVYDFNQNIANDTYDSIDLAHPLYWIKPITPLSTQKGHHRIVWNLRHNDPLGARRTFAISAVKNRTPSGPRGPFVGPGEYLVSLQVDGEEYTQALKVRMDPRVTASEEDIRLQTDLSLECYDQYKQLQEWRTSIESELEKSSTNKAALEKLLGNGQPRDGDILYGSIRSVSFAEETINSLQSKFLYLLQVLQSADARPTKATINAVEKLSERLDEMKEK